VGCLVAPYAASFGPSAAFPRQGAAKIQQPKKFTKVYTISKIYILNN
jgi:hypothetical protein